MTQHPAGWYQHPDGTQRYWDGVQWTQGPPPAGPEYLQSQASAGAGYAQGSAPSEAGYAPGSAAGYGQDPVRGGTGYSQAQMDTLPPKKPWFKKKRIVIPALLVLAVGVLSQLGGDDTEVAAPAPTATQPLVAETPSAVRPMRRVRRPGHGCAPAPQTSRSPTAPAARCG